MARILVVDDQPQILKMLDTLLSQKGHIVTSAVDAFDGLEKISAQPFEMVITDAIMPGGASGYDLVKTVRKNPDLKDLIVILLTGKREKKDVDRGIQAGVDDYVIKPIDPDLFLAKVDSLLRRKSSSVVAFNECPCAEEAGFALNLRIGGISEVGLSFSSPQPFQAGSKIKIQSDFFNKIGIEMPMLRVVSCEAHKEEALFAIKTQYIAMTEKSLQPLRVWIRSRQLNKAG